MALCPGLPRWSGTRKVKPIWIYWNKRQWVAVASAGPTAISWAICKSAHCPSTHHSVFYRLDTLPATQPLATKPLTGSDTWYGLSSSSNCNDLECPWKSFLYCRPFKVWYFAIMARHWSLCMLQSFLYSFESLWTGAGSDEQHVCLCQDTSSATAS